MHTPDVAELPALPEAPPKPIVFKIEADELKKVLRLAHIQTAAPLVDVDVTLTELHCRVFAKDKGLSIRASAPLYHPEHIQGARFKLEREMLSGIASNFDGVLSFAYDADQKSLRWFTEGKIGRYETEVLRSESEAEAPEAELLATMPVSALGDAIHQAALFASRRDRQNANTDGIRIGEQAARSGYTPAISMYSSSAIPNELQIYLPKKSAKAVRTALAKVSGPVDIFGTDTSIELHAKNLRVTWAKGSYWPAALDRVFKMPVTSSFSLPTSDVQRAIGLVSIGCSVVQLKIETQDETGRLVLTGHNGKNSRSETPVSPWMAREDLPYDHWIFALDVADLLDAAMAVRTETTVIEVIDRGLIVRAVAPSYETAVALGGIKAA